MRIALAASVFTLGLAACTGTVNDGQPGIRLSLSSSGDRLELQGSPIDPAYHGRYANPDGLRGMTVTMFGDGRLVGLCTTDSGARSCDDVPFFSNVTIGADGLRRLRAWDTRGELVVDHQCTAGDPVCAQAGGSCVASAGGGASDDDVGGGGGAGPGCATDCSANELGEGCFNGIDDDCDGLPDCADADCTQKCVEAGVDGSGGGGGGSGDDDSSNDGAEDDDGAPPADCPPPPAGSDCAALAAWAQACFCTGVNAAIDENGVPTDLDCGGLDGDYDGPSGRGSVEDNPYEGDVACSNDLIEDTEDEVSDYVDGSACPDLEVAVHNWASMADYELRSGGYCGHSPLVLDLAGDGVSLTPLAGGARFDLLGDGAQVECSWTQADDAFVVHDANGDGQVAGARELLGNATGGATHADGFAALATLDANHDGVVDAGDPAWAKLYAWRDDGDAISEPGELVSLASVGVAALPTGARRVTGADAWDGRGNRVPLVGSFTRAAGQPGVLVDAWLQYAPAKTTDQEVDALMRHLLGDVR